MAKFLSKTRALKNGQNIVIRSAEKSDAQEILHFSQAVFQNAEGQVLLLSELNPSLEEKEKNLENSEKSERNLLLVAEIDQKIIADLDFRSPPWSRLQHTGSFGLSVHPDWRQQGIGRILLEEMIQWAEMHPILEKINLQVLANNQKALGLYQKLGFKIDGKKTREIKLENGSYLDDYSMELILKK